MISSSDGIITKTNRLLSDGQCHDWYVDHNWVREHRDPLIGRTPDKHQDPYRAWIEILAKMRYTDEDWD